MGERVCGYFQGLHDSDSSLRRKIGQGSGSASEDIRLYPLEEGREFLKQNAEGLGEGRETSRVCPYGGGEIRLRRSQLGGVFVSCDGCKFVPESVTGNPIQSLYKLMRVTPELLKYQAFQDAEVTVERRLI